MIDEIQVQDVALIRSASMTPSAHLTVLTGETGAGKTALLSAAKLLMGARADKGAVREGSAAARVSGRFYLRASLAGGAPDDLASSADIGGASRGAAAGAASPATPAGHADPDARGEADGAEAGDDLELVVTRRLSADGRSRVTLNGAMASVTELAERVGPSIDLCGQHEHQALMASSSHGRLLDAWGGAAVAEARAAWDAAWTDAVSAAAAYERVCEAASASATALDEARFALSQIEAVNPQEGEYEELVAYLSRTENAEALARAAHGASEGLAGEGGALDALGAAASLLEDAARHDEALGAYAQSLREAGFIVEDVARDMASYAEDVEFDPAELAAAQERAAAFQGLLRSWGPRLEDVLARRDEAAELVASVDDADRVRREARERLDAAEEALAVAADALHLARAAAAPAFAAAVSAVMERLEMGSAALECQVDLLERSRWSKAGPDAVEFFFRPGAGMQARPLARIASGGEVSRVMLAVKVVLGAHDEVDTLIFDEVDAGVGGATAVALARVLADLARTHQVIVVTHLAQVAAWADTHYVVEKSDAEAPETTLREVSGADREAELARMLSGDATETSLAHAREMLAAAS